MNWASHKHLGAQNENGAFQNENQHQDFQKNADTRFKDSSSNLTSNEHTDLTNIKALQTTIKTSDILNNISQISEKQLLTQGCFWDENGIIRDLKTGEVVD